MGNQSSLQGIQKINFEDVQVVCKNPELYLLMNTLTEMEQGCLITGTISPKQEETLINRYMKTNPTIRIVVYGRNTNDESIYKKYNQLQRLGFTNVFLYMGGMFEWLLLQDIYGFEEFPTTTKQLDILKYKPVQRLNIALLENSID
jgi:hypothetical protein